jgi:hypothetical protein
MTSSFDANLGAANIQTKSGDFSKNLTSVSAIELNYNLNHTAANTAYTLSFAELLRTDEGSLTFTRLSLGSRWYPRGMSGGRLIIDNDVTARVWSASPFIGLGIGLSTMSIKEYNASFIDVGPKVGVEVPLSSSLLLLGQFTFTSSLSGNGAESKSVTYSGANVMVGVVFSGLEN